MADDDLDSQAATTDADPDGGDAAVTTSAPRMTREAKERADRDAFMKMWETDEAGGTLDDKAAAAAPVEPKKPAAAKPAKPEVLDDADDEPDKVGAGDEPEDDLDDDDELDQVEGDEDEERATATAKDPDLAKRLDQVRKQEKRGRDQLARDRQAFEKERDGFVAEWKPRIEAAQKYEELKANKDAVGLLAHAGIPEDDYEEVARLLYAMSPAGKADPKNKAAASALQRERALRARLDATEARSKALEEKFTKAENDAAHAKRVETYVGKVTAAIGEDTPLLKKSMELAPKATRARLERVAYKMAMEANSLDVDPKKVVRRFEKLRRAAIERDAPLGELLKAAPAKPGAAAPAKKPAIAVEDRSAAGAGGKPAAPTNGGGKITFPSKADIVARLREGNFDD